VAELVEDLAPIADRLGCATELHRARTILEVGASYQRQRAAAAAAGGDLRAVTDALIAEMRAQVPIGVVA